MRDVVNKKIKNHKQLFTSDGPLWVVSLDGPDQLCGHQNSTLRLGVFGCLDNFSGKVLLLFLYFSSSAPEVIRKNYLKYLSKLKLLPYFLRADRGTETWKMCSIQFHQQVTRLDNFEVVWITDWESILKNNYTIFKKEMNTILII